MKMLQYTTYLKISGLTPTTIDKFCPDILSIKGIIGVYKWFDTPTKFAWNVAVIRSEFSTTKTLLQQHLQKVNNDNHDHPPIQIHQSRKPSVLRPSNNMFLTLTFDPTTGTLQPWSKVPPTHNNNNPENNNNSAPSQITYSQIAQQSSSTTNMPTELQLLHQENAALCEKIALLKSKSNLQPSSASKPALDHVKDLVKAVLQPAMELMQQKATKEFNKQFASWFSTVTNQTNSILAQHKGQFDRWSDDAWLAITELLQDHDQALEDFCLNNTDTIDCEYLQLQRQQLTPSPHHESTSPILNLPSDTDHTTNKRDINALSDLSSEKANKHRSVADYMEDDNSHPSTTSTVTVDSNKKKIIPNPPKSLEGIFPFIRGTNKNLSEHSNISTFQNTN